MEIKTINATFVAFIVLIELFPNILVFSVRFHQHEIDQYDASFPREGGHAGHPFILTAPSRAGAFLYRDGMFPKLLARVTKTTHVPVFATLLIGLLTIAFAFTGTFDVLTDMAIFSALIFNGMAVASVYVLRRKLPNARRPYKVWGYPWVPGLFVLATAYLMINTLIATPGRAIAGILLTAAGLLVYWYYARKLPPDRPENWLPGEEEIEEHILNT